MYEHTIPVSDFSYPGVRRFLLRAVESVANATALAKQPAAVLSDTSLDDSCRVTSKGRSPNSLCDSLSCLPEPSPHASLSQDPWEVYQNPTFLFFACLF